MTPSQQNFILQTIAYLLPLVLVAVLIYFDGNSASTIFNTMIQKTEFNQGLKALEIVMSTPNNYTSGEITEILQAASTMFHKTTYLPSMRTSKELKILLGCCIAVYYLTLFVRSIDLHGINVSFGLFATLHAFGSWIAGIFGFPYLIYKWLKKSFTGEQSGSCERRGIEGEAGEGAGAGNAAGP